MKKKFISLHLKYYKTDLCIYLFLAFFAWAINFVSPYLTGNYLDFLVKGDGKAVVWFTLVLALINIINIILGYIYEKALSKLNTNVAFKISFTLYERLKKAYLSYYYNIDTVYLVNRINNDSNAVIRFVTSNMVSLITQSLALFLGIGIIYYISFPITVVILLAIPIYVALYKLFRQKLYNTNYDFMEKRSQYFAKMTEQFNYIKFIKMHSLFEVFANRLHSTYNSLFESMIRYFKVNYLFVNANSLILCVVSAFTFFYGGLSVINGNMSVGQYTIINVYFNIIMQALKYFLELGKGYQEYLVSFNRLLELYNVEIENNGNTRLQDVHTIKVESLKFSYQPLSKAVISDLNIEFSKGNVYSLTGRNGAGKSSFICTLLGLFNDLYQGRILYNECDLRGIDIYDLRIRLLAVTEQEPVLLNASIYDNIFVADHQKKEEIKKYFELFNIANLIEITGVPKEEYIKQNLSGGEKQKISIIRTLLKDTPVMIFDEPTSALDKSGKDIFKAIITKIKNDKIIILITHDDDLMEISDDVISFD